MIKQTLFILALLFAINASSQVTIKGQVFDETGETIISAKVKDDKETLLTLTDFEGYFELIIEENSDIEYLKIEAMGKTQKLVPIDTFFNNSKPTKIILSPEFFDGYFFVHLKAKTGKIEGNVISSFDSCAVHGFEIKVGHYENKFLKKIKTIDTVIISDINGDFEFEQKQYTHLFFEANYYHNNDVKINSIIEEQNIKLKTELTVPVIAAKPIIYLYPETQTDVSLKLSFNGEVSNTYPEYGEGWEVTANPNGELINRKDGSKHRYLFWDGENNDNINYDFSTGFLVSKEQTLAFLDSTLTNFGLTDYEKNDFITFWLPLMRENEYNLVHFNFNEKCDEIATLHTTPKPDTEIRVYILYQKADKFTKIEPQKIPKTTRKGFTLVEWGGMEIENRINGK